MWGLAFLARGVMRARLAGREGWLIVVEEIRWICEHATRGGVMCSMVVESSGTSDLSAQTFRGQQQPCGGDNCSRNSLPA